jgi:hypothetical protein
MPPGDPTQDRYLEILIDLGTLTARHVEACENPAQAADFPHPAESHVQYQHFAQRRRDSAWLDVNNGFRAMPSEMKRPSRSEEEQWDLTHFALLNYLARDDRIDWSRAVVDSCSICAVYGGDQTGPNQADRAKRGSKRHLICDGCGVPLAVRPTGRKSERLAGSP